MNKIDINCGEYASKWSLTDFYPKSEEKLRQALDSGEDFDTGWFYCKKEIRSGKYVREGDQFTTDVEAYMDDLYDSDDLIYDAQWEVFGIEEEIPENIIEAIKEDAVSAGINDGIWVRKTIPSSEATFDRVVYITNELEQEAESKNKEMYMMLCNIVSAYF